MRRVVCFDHQFAEVLGPSGVVVMGEGLRGVADEGDVVRNAVYMLDGLAMEMKDNGFLTARRSQ